MANPTQKEATRVEEIIHSVVCEYLADRTIIYRSEGEFRERHFAGRSRRAKNWAKPSSCMVSSCGNPSVERSHAIPKGFSLSSIADSNHVLRPVYDHKTSGLVLERVGINQASTFRGFCNDHEALFKDFENRGALKTDRDSVLQAYRAACRETFRATFDIGQLDRDLSDYRSFRDQRLRELIAERIFRSQIKGVFYRDSLNFGADPMEREMADLIDGLRHHANHFKRDVLPAFERAVFSDDLSGIHGQFYDIDVLVPVALSGAGTFYVKCGGTAKRVDVLVSVVPRRGNTLIFVCGESVDREHIDTYASSWMTDSLEMLSMIESWMVNGTDQWYLKPLVWESLTDRARQAIIEQISNRQQTIGHEFEFSIFDELRKSFLQMLAKTPRANTPANLAHADKHRKKLSAVAN